MNDSAARDACPGARGNCATAKFPAFETKLFSLTAPSPHERTAGKALGS